MLEYSITDMVEETRSMAAIDRRLRMSFDFKVKRKVLIDFQTVIL